METSPGDIVLIHHKDQPLGYARVEEIVADVKPGWWQLRLLFLSVPPSEVTWILRDAYIDGDEFTMGGDVMRLERLPAPAPAEDTITAEPEQDPEQDTAKDDGADQVSSDDSGDESKVVSLAERRKGKP